MNKNHFDIKTLIHAPNLELEGLEIKIPVGEVSGSHSIKSDAVIWDDVSCILVEVYRLLVGAYCLHHQGDNDGGNKPPLNAG
jgi:hypothetical protein